MNKNCEKKTYQEIKFQHAKSGYKHTWRLINVFKSTDTKITDIIQYNGGT